MRNALKGSSVACLAWSIPASLVLFVLRGGHSHEMAGDYGLINRAAHCGGSRACCSCRVMRQHGLLLFFFVQCQGQVASVMLIKETVACRASRFCTENETLNGCCQSGSAVWFLCNELKVKHLYTKRQPGTQKDIFGSEKCRHSD